MTPTNQMIRVLVVDDSALMRKLIPQLLERDNSIHVVGTAMDGAFALKKIEELKPDAITLDLEMPRMDGIETLRQIMRAAAGPGRRRQRSHPRGRQHHLQGSAHGSLRLCRQAGERSGRGHERNRRRADRQDQGGGQQSLPAPPAARLPASPPSPSPSARSVLGPASKVVAIGISTGGPNSLEYMLSQLPADFPAAILVVQHMPAGFTETFARRLNESCNLEVKEAQSGDLVAAGRVLICPGDRHMRVRRMPLGDVVVLSDDAKVNGHRPSVDVLFRSVAQEFGADAVGLLMTGMGEDGAEGLGVMQAAGALTIAQDEASSIVFGMPRAAIERGYANRVVGLGSFGQHSDRALRRRPRRAGQGTVTRPLNRTNVRRLWSNFPLYCVPLISNPSATSW